MQIILSLETVSKSHSICFFHLEVLFFTRYSQPKTLSNTILFAIMSSIISRNPTPLFSQFIAICANDVGWVSEIEKVFTLLVMCLKKIFWTRFPQFYPYLNFSKWRMHWGKKIWLISGIKTQLLTFFAYLNFSAFGTLYYQ